MGFKRKNLFHTIKQSRVEHDLDAHNDVSNMNHNNILVSNSGSRISCAVVYPLMTLRRSFDPRLTSVTLAVQDHEVVTVADPGLSHSHKSKPFRGVNPIWPKFT